MFDTGVPVEEKYKYPKIKEFNKETKLRFEKEFVGVYISGHPLNDYVSKFKDFNLTSDMMTYEEPMEGVEDEAPQQEVESQIHDGMEVVCGGIISEVKKRFTKSKQIMASVKIEDIYGVIECVAFPRSFENNEKALVEDGLVTIYGKVTVKDGERPQVIIDRVVPWQTNTEPQNVDERRLYLRFDLTDKELYDKVVGVVAEYDGDCQVIARCTSQNKTFKFKLTCDINNYLINQLNGLLGSENVVVK